MYDDKKKSRAYLPVIPHGQSCVSKETYTLSKKTNTLPKETVKRDAKETNTPSKRDLKT